MYIYLFVGSNKNEVNFVFIYEQLFLISSLLILPIFINSKILKLFSIFKKFIPFQLKITTMFLLTSKSKISLNFF